MKKQFTYANELTVVGTILNENEHGYLVEFLDESVVKGFTDTMFMEKELTVVTELNEELTTIVDYKGNNFTGVAVHGNKYTYLVSQDELSPIRIKVRRFVTEMVENKTSYLDGQVITHCNYHWDVNKNTLKGSGGLSEKVMKVVKSLI